MGRSKAYEPLEALERARALFTEKGFSATSISDLEEHLGINRKSMYAEFGSKQDLFEAVLRLHDERVVTYHVGPLESPDAGLPEIRAVLTSLATGARGPQAGLGCLLCNTASERAHLDAGSREHVRAYVERISAAYWNALKNALNAGQLLASVDLDQESRFLTSHMLGQLTLLRSNVAPEVIESASEVVLRHLRSLESDR